MWSNASSAPVELQPAAASLGWAAAGIALAAVGGLLVLSGVPAGAGTAALLLAAGGLARAAGRGPACRCLRSPLPGRWSIVPRAGLPLEARLLRAWALGRWLAAASFVVPGGRRITVVVLGRDQQPAAWRRCLVRLRTT